MESEKNHKILDTEPTKEEKIASFQQQRKREKARQTRKLVFRIVGIVLAVCFLLFIWMQRDFLFSGEFSERSQLMLAELRGGSGFPYAVKGESVKASN